MQGLTAPGSPAPGKPVKVTLTMNGKSIGQVKAVQKSCCVDKKPSVKNVFNTGVKKP